MKIMEIANAEEQLALLRLIMDKTWDAVAVQAEQQKRAEAERMAQAKLKPPGKKSSKGTSIRIPTPLKNPNPPLSKQPAPTPNVPNPNKANTINPIRSTVKPISNIQPQTNPQLKPLPNSIPTSAQNTLNVPKDGYLDMNIDAVQNNERGDDRYSKNGIRTLKK